MYGQMGALSWVQVPPSFQVRGLILISHNPWQTKFMLVSSICALWYSLENHLSRLVNHCKVMPRFSIFWK